MKAIFEIIRLEFLAAVRSRTVLLLSVASVLWMFALPYLIASDGTAEGAHRIYVRYSLGAVFALLSVSLAAAAAGSLAKDRAARRLQLTLVRPVRFFWIALGRTIALTSVGAFVLLLSAACALIQTNPTRTSYHVLAPVMESPQAEAERMYDAFMASPHTPPAVKSAKRSVVLRLLAQKAFDYYQTIPTNTTMRWNFAQVPADSQSLAVRLRFTTTFNTREDVRGEFTLGDYASAASNVTQSVVMFPLEANGTNAVAGTTLTFRNEGKSSLMLRPRRDIHLLYETPYSFFAVNLALAVVEMIALLAVVIAFALFLSAGLGRSVAVFTVFVSLFLSAVSPAIIEQYPDQLETDRRDRIGLMITRFADKVSSPIASFNPVSALAEDEMIEPADAARAVALDLIFLPLLLALAAGILLPRKQQEV